MKTTATPPAPSPLDLAQRQAAQAALVFGIDPTQIVTITIIPAPDEHHPLPRLRVSLPTGIRERDITESQRIMILAGWDLVATEKTVTGWSRGHVDEYRRQYNPARTGSFASTPTVHPDQVDLWFAESHQ